MKYTNEVNDHHYTVDSEKAAEFIRIGFIFVRPSSHEERVKIIEMLRKEGYEGFEELYQGSSLESIYPLMISFKEKKYSHLQTNTSAAAACSQQIVISEKEFYLMYSYLKIC